MSGPPISASPDNPPPLRTGDRLTLRVDRAAFGGSSIAHAPDGRVVFIRGVAPGDTAHVEITSVERSFLHGRAVDVDPGPDRAEPFCPHLDRCGGCPWMIIPGPDQRATLRAHVERALSRVQSEAIEAPVEAPPPHRAWRSTARLHYAGDRLGYYAPGSRDLVDIDRCPILRPPLPTLYAAVRARLLPHLEGVGTLRLTAAPDAPSGTLALSPEQGTSEALARAVADFVAAEPSCHGAVIKRRHRTERSFGDAFDRLGPHAVPHPAGAFVQAHQTGNDALVAAVVEALAPARRVLELHAGSGNFTLALAAAGHTVVALERDATAVAALAREAELRGLADRVDARCGDADRPPRDHADAALLDPPRRGARDTVRALADRPLGRIVYVSCNPATLTRDIDVLARRGWRIRETRTFDLFPHTGHVEVLAVLERHSRGSPDGR